jgi:hypothetical protein
MGMQCALLQVTLLITGSFRLIQTETEVKKYITLKQISRLKKR